MYSALEWLCALCPSLIKYFYSNQMQRLKSKDKTAALLSTEEGATAIICLGALLPKQAKHPTSWPQESGVRTAVQYCSAAVLCLGVVNYR